jgi:tRNA G10  N-methylase Trm11
MQSLLILGRQPALGLAELESLYGVDKVRPVGSKTVIVDIDPCLLAFDRLGGSVKFCKLLSTLDTTNWGKIEKYLLQVSPGHAQTMPEGKMQLGLSLYGFNETPKRIEATGLSLKKVIRKTGRSVRLIPNKTAELNSAQVLHNHLTGPTGWELIFIKDGRQTLVAQTVKVQDIEAYTRRDRQRPKRDAKVGMLPPKLAQIIINLAAGELPEDKLESICDIPAGQPIPRPILDKTVIDPFCGSGVVLQEALLMGYDIYGSDLEQRMVDYSKQNIDWLNGLYNLEATDYRLEIADATAASWSQPIDFVATETYLGRPFTARPTPEILAQTVADCNLIIKKFLQNIHGQAEPETRFCLAIPAWQTSPNQFKHLPLIDQISELGYNRVSFEHARDTQLIYCRPDQIVGRELIVITRK